METDGNGRAAMSGRQGRHLATVCLAALLPLAAMPPSAARDGESAIFGKWHTFCGADLLCAAYTYSGTEGNPHSGHLFTLERPREGDGWTMSLTLDGVEPKLSLGLQASIVRYGHDDEPIPPFWKDTLALHGGRSGSGQTDGHVLYLMGASAGTVMTRLRPGDILDFEFGGCRDEFLFANFSLEGVTAALAWIDGKQQLTENRDGVSSDGTGRGTPATFNCGEAVGPD